MLNYNRRIVELAKSKYTNCEKRRRYFSNSAIVIFLIILFLLLTGCAPNYYDIVQNCKNINETYACEIEKCLYQDTLSYTKNQDHELAYYRCLLNNKKNVYDYCFYNSETIKYYCENFENE